MSVELLVAMNASCGACASLGPPPSAILTLPPPPLPAFLKAPQAQDTDTDADQPCDLQAVQGLGGLPQTCDWSGGRAGAPGVEYVELPRQIGGMGVGADDDTWFLVLVSCSAGVLLLGAILAIVLMRCRQGRGSKCVLSLDPSTLDGHGGKSSKLVGGEVLYPDPRALWAALTPSGGTQHFVGPSSQHGGALPLAAPAPAPAPAAPPHLQLTQRHLTAPSPPPSPAPPAISAEPEYAMPLTAGPPPLEPPPPPPVRLAAFTPPPPPQTHGTHGRHKHPRQHGHVNKMATLSHHASFGAGLVADANSSFDFDNSGFVDSDDQLLGGDLHDGGGGGGYSSALGALGYYHTVGGSRRGLHVGVLRPKVSSPTRIANPNLPPLNLHPSATGASTLGGSSSSVASGQSRRSLRRAGRDGREAREAREAAREARHAAERESRHGADRYLHHHASNGTLAL